VRLIRRKRFWIDPKVQGAMLARVAAYWLFYLVAISQVLLCWQIIQSPPGPFWSHFRYDLLWQQYSPVVVASLVLLPFLLIDAVVFSNRFTGPLYRVRNAMKRLIAGETVEPVHFRKHDYRPELADEFNALSQYVENLRHQAAGHHGSSSVASHEEPHLEETAAR
jgi:hypothetical protein